MRKFHAICFGILLCGLLPVAHAENFEVNGGQTLSGNPVSFNEKGVIFRLDNGSYADRTDWSKFTQDSLKKLAQNPKAAPFVEPLIESTVEKKAAETAKVALVIKTDFAKLDRPAPQGLIKSIFTSGLGLFTCLLIYAANLYAGYEISSFRAQPVRLVCGVSAVAPIIGPIVFLCLPTQLEAGEDLVQEPMQEKESYQAGDVPGEADLSTTPALDKNQQLPPTKTFARGQFTFNRRFFETSFPGFFSILRRDADKNMILIFKAARGTYVVGRISRISANELYVQVNKGDAAEEVMIPFVEIQEVVLKHKDAKLLGSGF